MQQAREFEEESEALLAQVVSLDAEALRQAVAFKGWTIEEVVRHLHVWNLAAGLSLRGGEAFQRFYAQAEPHVDDGTTRVFERQWSAGLEGPALVERWQQGFREIASDFAEVDPSRRVEWAGPSMSARSSITARLMETWAHGQAIYDLFGAVHENTDRIRNIVVLGFNTYGWSFQVHGKTPPEPIPHLHLTSPSGAIWSYGEPSDVESIEGTAEAFCQVVTQTRNVRDTSLRVRGPNATAWMREAQCFAGRPETPPAVGTRGPAR